MNKDPQKIQSMFARIAPVYDLFNSLLSVSIDKRWRIAMARVTVSPKSRKLLDLACGTGESTRQLRKMSHPDCEVLGIDFCLPMLQIAHKKGFAPFFHGDAMKLPLRDCEFDAVSIAFGLRNVLDPKVALQEMLRVLRPGGRVVILEFSTPNVVGLRQLYLGYFRHILPLVGNLFSKSTAYAYLRDSVLEWPEPDELSDMLESAGFVRPRFVRKTFGVVAIHVAEKPRKR